MSTRATWVLLALLFVIAVWGGNPFAERRDTSGLLVDGYGTLETGVERQSNGIVRVRALTRMPGARAEMVRWWFADYMNSTDHYRRWHPTDHVWMDWENKRPGEIVGASHLVHEYLGGELSKLRIQFVDPGEFLGPGVEEGGRVAVCARAGLLEEPLNVSTLCHVVRDTEWGAEMRSVFWLGDISAREGNENVFSMTGLAGNTFLARRLLLDNEFAVALMTHALEEMGTLGDFLPGLYAEEQSRVGEDREARGGG